VASEAPPFWWEEPDWKVLALSPLSAIYAMVAGRGMRRARREKIEAPVLCVGNFTVGGTGKTPVAIALAEQAKRMRLKPGFLSRGHGGSFAEPHVVDPHHDAAKHVGDERIGGRQRRQCQDPPVRLFPPEWWCFGSHLSARSRPSGAT